jgi:hypothetical protein
MHRLVQFRVCRIDNISEGFIVASLAVERLGSNHFRKKGVR